MVVVGALSSCQRVSPCLARKLFSFSSALTPKVVANNSRTMASDGKYIGTTTRGLTKDFSFPVPWGQLSGKTWGDAKKPPILCLHGWLDNCNTFDKLIPLLPSEYYYVAFDMPGHGFSSHFPPGMFYFTAAYCSVLKRLVDHFKFSKVTLLGHSMGANVATYFGGIYPEIACRIIVIDTIGLWFRIKDDLVTSLRSCIDSHLAFENNRPQKEYTYVEAKERLSGANKNLNEEAVEILLERGMKKLENGNFVFTRDVRHLFKDPLERDLETSLVIVENIKADVMFVVAKEGMWGIVGAQFKKECQRSVDTFRKHCKSFRFVEVEGNHHLHLCTPEGTAKEIAEFLRKHPVEETVEKPLSKL